MQTYAFFPRLKDKNTIKGENRQKTREQRQGRHQMSGGLPVCSCNDRHPKNRTHNPYTIKFSNYSITGNIPPKEVRLSDFICIFAMSVA